MAKKPAHDDDDDDFDVDAESWSEDDDEEPIDEGPHSAARLMGSGRRQRDWRDLERYREERELRKLMEDDYLFDDDKPRWSQR